MPEEQEAKPAEKKPSQEIHENLPEFVPTPAPEQSEVSKPVEQPIPVSAQPVIPPGASTSKLTADEIAILNAMETEKEEMKTAPTAIPPTPAPALPVVSIARPIIQPAPSNVSPVTASPVPEKKKFELHFPFIGKPKEAEQKPQITPSPAIPTTSAKPAEKKPLLPILTLAKKPEQTASVTEKPAEKIPAFSMFAKKPQEKKDAPSPAPVENTEKKLLFAPQIVTDNWKKIVPVLLLVGVFAVFLMLRNSFSYMTGYAISGVPLLTTDYISIIIMGLLAFAAIFGTEKLMNKMYKYM